MNPQSPGDSCIALPGDRYLAACVVGPMRTPHSSVLRVPGDHHFWLRPQPGLALLGHSCGCSLTKWSSAFPAWRRSLQGPASCTLGRWQPALPSRCVCTPSWTLKPLSSSVLCSALTSSLTAASSAFPLAVAFCELVGFQEELCGPMCAICLVFLQMCSPLKNYSTSLRTNRFNTLTV